LSNPLRAIETYQEYLGLAGDNETIRSQIFSIAQQLVGKQRYLEALHVFGAFVDSFPIDPRAAQALLQIGQTHQANEAWTEAMQAYDRILAEYPGVPITPQVKLAVAECHINLSQWRQARKLYEEYVQQFPSDGQAEMARQRIEVLKNLDRYQTLLADDQVQRNKDDAQFQIGPSRRSARRAAQSPAGFSRKPIGR
jgi:TolA-binding protein